MAMLDVDEENGLAMNKLDAERRVERARKDGGVWSVLRVRRELIRRGTAIAIFQDEGQPRLRDSLGLARVCVKDCHVIDSVHDQLIFDGVASPDPVTASTKKNTASRAA